MPRSYTFPLTSLVRGRLCIAPSSLLAFVDYRFTSAGQGDVSEKLPVQHSIRLSVEVLGVLEYVSRYVANDPERIIQVPPLPRHLLHLSVLAVLVFFAAAAVPLQLGRGRLPENVAARLLA